MRETIYTDLFVNGFSDTQSFFRGLRWSHPVHR